MLAYEIYQKDPIRGYEFIGVLPERRKNPARITEESITSRAREVFGRSLDITRIFIIQLEIDKKLGRSFRRAPSFIIRSGISNVGS